MQELHLVGMTRDLDGLIFSVRKGSKSGGFVVSIDARLVESVEAASRLRLEGGGETDGLPRPAPEPGPRRETRLVPKRESRLTPREMQARLRAGHSIEQVARAAGVSPEWVERFSPPVAAERARVVDTALALTSSKARVGESALPLAQSVRVNLYDRGVPLVPEPGGWTALNTEGSRWLVRYEYESRRRRQMAEWELDFETRILAPRNRLATELGYVDSARGRRPAPPAGSVPSPESLPPAPAVLPLLAPAKGRRSAALSASVPTEAELTAAKATPRKATPRKATPRKATPRKATPRKASGPRPRAPGPQAAAPRLDDRSPNSIRLVPGYEMGTRSIEPGRPLVDAAPAEVVIRADRAGEREPVRPGPSALPPMATQAVIAPPFPTAAPPPTIPTVTSAPTVRPTGTSTNGGWRRFTRPMRRR